MQYDFFTPKRTHICTFVQNLIKGVVGICVFLAVIWLLDIFGGKPAASDSYVDPYAGLTYAVTAVVLFAVVFIYALIGWRKKKYYIEGEQLRVSGGVTTNSLTCLIIPKLKSVSQKENWLQRLFHASCLSINGIDANGLGDGSAAVTLVLHKEEADALRSLLENKSNHLQKENITELPPKPVKGSVYGATTENASKK